MQAHSLEPMNPARLPVARTVRDWVALGFRHGRLIVASYLAIFLGAILITWWMPSRYQAQTKILVKRERVDPVVSPDPNTQLATTADLTEQDLNSEVELLKSRDLLEKVVVASGLHRIGKQSFLRSLLAKADEGAGSQTSAEQVRILRAVQSLQRSLDVEPLKKTKLIIVTYESPDPQLSAKVLQTIVRFYLEKHVAVHRVPGALDFFQNQTEEYRSGLIQAEGRLTAFGQDTGVFAAPMEKEITLRKMNDFEAELQNTKAGIAAAEQRIHALEEQLSSTPERLTTVVKLGDNALLLQQMKSSLLNLELKRSELLTQFSPQYRLVQQIEAQIKETRERLATEENKPVREEVTDRDATHEWVRGELSKARAELKSLKARASATTRTITTYRRQARQLNQTEINQQNLIRTAKIAEDNFLLYSRKQEEARIRDALDQQRIVNVSVAEEPTVPALPSNPNPLVNIALGGLLAGLVSFGLAYVTDRLDASFRTPQEVELFLNTPVLAALPED